VSANFTESTGEEAALLPTTLSTPFAQPRVKP